MTRPYGQHGLILVAVLWTAALLLVLMAVLGRTSRLDTTLSVFSAQQVRCRWASKAGIEKAIGILAEDTRDSDTLSDLWADNDTELVAVPLTDCSFTVRAIDEAGKLNVNIATKAQLMALPDMTDEIADAILDWRDRDDTPREAGVEAGYYEALPYRYTIRNGPFRAIRELLKVKGVTEDLFFGEDTNFNGRLDDNERDGSRTPPNDDGDMELDLGWIEFLTCYSYEADTDATGTARVNINQANEQQLQQSLGITAGQARWIVDNRGSNYRGIGYLVRSGGSNQSSDASRNQTNRSDTQKGSNTSGRQNTSNRSGSDSGSSENVRAEPIDTDTFKQIADKITVGDGQVLPGKVNVNTAPREVLVALFGGDAQAEQTALDVIAQRQTLAYGLQSVGDLLDVSSINISAFRRIADRVTVRSNVYTIYSVATADQTAISGATAVTETVVDRGATPCKILYQYQGADFR